MRALKIGRDIDMINGNDGRIERDFAGDNPAEFTFYQFVYAQ